MPYTKTVRESPVLGHEKGGQAKIFDAYPPDFRPLAIAFRKARAINATSGFDLRHWLGTEQTGH